MTDFIFMDLKYTIVIESLRYFVLKLSVLLFLAGPGARNDRGDTIPMSVQVGDIVILPEYGGTKLEFADKQEYAMFRESDIVAKLGKE